MSYAENTSVPVEKTRAEIESTLSKYGATRFAYMIGDQEAVIGFSAHGKFVKFTLPLPRRDESRFWVTPTRKNRRTPEEAYKEWEQACRSRWRSLYLAVKAKLEAVSTGITTFEAEFLAYVVVPGGETLGQRIIPQLEEMQKSGRMPTLTLMAGGDPR